jgi:hypothetical protein
MRLISVRFARSARIGLAAAAVLALVSTARAAETPDMAALLFENARGDMKRGDFAAAREKFVESLRFEQTVGTLFNLGLCEEKLGLLRDSLLHLQAALAKADDADRRRAVMTELIASLDRRVPRVILKRKKEGSTQLRVTFDGGTVDATLEGHEVLTNPGAHEIVVRGPGGPPQMMTVPVDEGETVVKVVEWRADPAAQTVTERAAIASPPLAPPANGVVRQRLGAVVVNVGGAALIAGGVLGFMTLGKKISVDHHCSDGTCDEAGLRASAEGASYSTAGTALTVAGLASMSIGSYLLLRPGAAADGRATARERKVGIIAGSVGAAAIVASAIAGGVALSAKRTLLDRCADGGPCNDPEGLDAAARGRTAATFATIALGLGVAGLGVASYSLVLRPRFAPDTDVRLTLSPSTVACTATF